MLASVSGHMATIRALVDAGANYDPLPSLSSSQITPLMIAAQHGNDAVVRLYLDKGVNANKAVPKTGLFVFLFFYNFFLALFCVCSSILLSFFRFINFLLLLCNLFLFFFFSCAFLFLFPFFGCFCLSSYCLRYV